MSPSVNVPTRVPAILGNKCRPPDRSIGSCDQEIYQRLHLVANNTRVVALAEREVFANLASGMMSAMLRRLSDDLRRQYGHPLLVVQSFEDQRSLSTRCMRRRTGPTWQQQGYALQWSLHRTARQAEAAGGVGQHAGEPTGS